MAKMTDEALLGLLQAKEDDSATYVWGQLGSEREKAMRQYHRLPYGNEEEGWSQIVTSDIQDTVEWVLPDLLDVFVTTDKVVNFEPSRARDMQPAAQATEAVNHVFFKQNNGFLNLYTAFKDALIVRNGVLMWRKETRKEVTIEPFTGASLEMLVMLTSPPAEAGDTDGEGAAESEDYLAKPEKPEYEVMEVTERQMVGPDGLPATVFDGRLRKVEERTIVKVEAVEPENLLVDRRWTSPLLDECPYVCRVLQVTLSELHQMGFEDVTAEELAGSDGSSYSGDASFRLNRIGQSDAEDIIQKRGESNADDESLSEGWLRIEFVRADVDGDGVAELRCIYRLQNKILKNDPVNHVPIATASPVLNTHRWDGLSFADLVSDLQMLHTELMRQTLNSLYLANNPRTKVMTDANWSPMANIDDLLDARPGGIIRQRADNAVVEHVTPFVGQQAFPMLEYVQGLREARTGVSRFNQGMDADSLNHTATGVGKIQAAGAKRVKLIARIFAETLVKPCMAGILKLLTDGGMKQMAFRLRDEFVEYDPRTWRDQYDMTINVGIGTGDRDQQMAYLQTMLASQMQMVQSGLGGIVVRPEQIYATLSKLTEYAGFKNVNDYWIDPKTNPRKIEDKQREQQNPEVQKLQMQAQMKQAEMQAQAQLQQQKLQTESALRQQETQAKMTLEERQAQANLQQELARSSNDIAIEREKIAAQMELERYKAELDARTKLQIEQLRLQAMPPAMPAMGGLPQ
ncbi:MAG: hypothetical protein RJA34_1232 [Pseudomonadota bacterium]|jgi:hypothetical protein